LEYTDVKLYRLGDIIMDVQSVMWLEIGTDKEIRCKFPSEWFKMDFYVPSKEKLFSEIDKTKPDVVVMDLDLYERMDGIETSRKIRSRFDVPVVYV
jgi:CheY-like chemotaxis protein